ncbi:tetratricopeptide repeat protein [Candidatus Woesearchaeota archaeon]|nr:tetratricopeptide repeat protein [Candidatus Woesearchaeota archaeon]
MANSGLANVYLYEGDLDKFKHYYNKSFMLGMKKDPWFYHSIGTTYFSLGLFNQSASMFERANNLIKSDRIYSDLGWSYYELRDYKKAYLMFNDSVKLNPNNFHATAGVGTMYALQNKTKQAEEYYFKTIKINPDHKLSYYRLGRLYYKLGELTKSKEFLNKSITLALKSYNTAMDFKSIISSYQLMGIIYLKEKNLKRSIFCFNQAIKFSIGYDFDKYLYISINETKELLDSINKSYLN